MDFELLKKLIQCGVVVSSFGKKESAFGLENSSITIRNDSRRSTIIIELFDEDTVAYRYKLLRDISKHKNRELEIIDYFVESLRENPQALKKFQRKINALTKENDDASKAIKLVQTKSWGFVHKKMESCFMIGDVSVSYKNWGKASSCFSVLTKNYHNFPKYLSVDSYEVSNPSDESIANAFIFSLKYQRGANSILKFLHQVVCDRSEKWVKRKGM